MPTEEIINFLTMNILPIVTCIGSILVVMLRVLSSFKELKNETAEEIRKLNKELTDILEETTEKLDTVVSENRDLRKVNKKLVEALTKVEYEEK